MSSNLKMTKMGFSPVNKYISDHSLRVFAAGKASLVKENNPNCHVVLSSSIDRLDDGKAALTIKRLNGSFLNSSLNIINNSNVGHSFLGMHELHLNELNVGRLALTFFKRVRSILNSWPAKQRLKEVHSKISIF